MPPSARKDRPWGSFRPGRNCGQGHHRADSGHSPRWRYNWKVRSKAAICPREKSAARDPNIVLGLADIGGEVASRGYFSGIPAFRNPGK
jgi:hypothetical protein